MYVYFMAQIYFKQTKDLTGTYWKLYSVKWVKDQERSRLGLLLHEYLLVTGDIGRSEEGREAAMFKLRQEMVAAGHILHKSQIGDDCG